MDIFVEQIIHRKMSPIDLLITFGVTLAGLILMVLCFLFIPSFLFFVFAGVCFGIYWVVSSRNLEFEYSVTNGDLTVDKIINRRSRKRVVSLDCKDVDAMGKYKAQDHAAKSYDKKLFVGIRADGTEGWYVSARTKKFGHVLLVFDPNDRVLEAMRPFLPRQLAFEVFGRPNQKINSGT